MAAIDKIYGTLEEFDTLYAWVKENAPKDSHYLQYFYPRDGYGDDNRPISNFPSHVDAWLWDNCPFAFVQIRLNEQYSKRPYDTIFDSSGEELPV